MKRNVKQKKTKTVRGHRLDYPQANIVIGGKLWTVRGTSTDQKFEGSSMFGRCRPEFQEIIYLLENTEEGIKDTVLHELLHALDWHGQLKLKERQVHVLASILLQCMWDNPELFDWLKSNPNRRK